MSSEWKTLPLGDVLELVIDHRGKTPKKLGFDDFHPEGYPVLSAKHVKTEGLANMDSMRFASHELYVKWMKVPVEAGDIVLTSEAPMGEVFYIDGSTNYVLGQRVFGLRPKKNLIEPRYLLAWLSSEVGQNRLLERATGSTVQGIKQSELLKVEIDVPPLCLQSVIASNEEHLSSKIAINQQINQTLEQMAQAIFKSWFVDFEPVKAKIAALEDGGTKEDALIAAMKAISGKDKVQLARFKTEQPEQYNELRTTAELFPSAMQDSELGEIPEGWEVLPLSGMVNLIGGGTPKKSEPSFWGGSICWFSVKDVPSEGNVFVVETKDRITEEGLSRSSTKLLPVGTTIITARGTVGKLALTGVPTAMNQSCYGVIANDGTGSYLNYLRLSEAVEILRRNTHGAVFDTITRGTFDTVLQTRACIALRQRFEAHVTPVFGAIRNNLLQSNNLSGARDLLLPRLLSGDLSSRGPIDQVKEGKESLNV